VEVVNRDFREAGKCAFAKRDIKANEIIGVYDGEIIDRAEAEQLERQYAVTGERCGMYHLEYSGMVINPHSEKKMWETSGITFFLNHSKKHSNIVTKQLKINDRPCVVMISKYYIPEGAELLYNYGDEKAPFFANSQTFPN
ncbi:N-lysine methyltransferase KMT5A-like, partial [Saccoglossus kowalevskii]